MILTHAGRSWRCRWASSIFLVFFVLRVPVFMEQFADTDIIVLVLKCDVVGKKPEFGMADVEVVYPDTCYFHGRCGGWG